MALMKVAQVWERFILKDVTRGLQLAKVELTPPGPGDLVGAVKGVGGLVSIVLIVQVHLLINDIYRQWMLSPSNGPQ